MRAADRDGSTQGNWFTQVWALPGEVTPYYCPTQWLHCSSATDEQEDRRRNMFLGSSSWLWRWPRRKKRGRWNPKLDGSGMCWISNPSRKGPSPPYILGRARVKWLELDHRRARSSGLNQTMSSASWPPASLSQLGAVRDWRLAQWLTQHAKSDMAGSSPSWHIRVSYPGQNHSS